MTRQFITVDYAATLQQTVTLAACLPAAFVLTQLAEESSPAICQVLEGGGIPCREVAAGDPWQKQESDLLRQVLVQTGLGKWIWSGLRLAVLHLAAPAACTVEVPDLESIEQIDYGLNETAIPSIRTSIDYWREAQGFWYPL